jgi:hypothetical protein
LNPELLRALVTIVTGAIAGGITNTIAVWMLFHPYEPPKLGPFRLRFLHGAIPKNQGRLAEAVGRTVGNRLLTPDDLTEILANEEFRAAFEGRLSEFIAGLLEKERGALRHELPPETVAELENLLEGAARVVGEKLDAWLATNQFEVTIREWTEGAIRRIAAGDVADVLTPARGEALAAAFETWAGDLVRREGFREAVDRYVERTLESLLSEDHTFEALLPAGLSSSVERAVAGYLPIVVRKLGEILEDPDARARLQATLRDLFQRFLGDLRFHQRIFARLVVTEETLDRVLDTIETEGAEHLSEMLRDPAVQDATARKVSEAVFDLAQRPITSVLGRPGDESVDKARETLVDWIVRAARDPDTLALASGELRKGLGRASEATWGELLEGLPPERVSRAVVVAIRSPAARRAYREVTAKMLRGVLDRPIGRPAAWLPADAPVRIEKALVEPLWGWARSQIPHVVAILDVRRRVEEKMRGYPTKKLEELVRTVTRRELRLIVRLGYVLGAVVGVVLAVVERWL